MPYALFCRSAPAASFSALWFLGPLPFSTQRTALALKYLPFQCLSQPFSTAYRLISSFHSNGALLSLGAGRKRVFLSVEGWSRLRTQHTSPDLDHWPAQHRARARHQRAAVMIHGCGAPPDLYTKSPWAAGGGAGSPTRSAARTSTLPTDDRWRPGSMRKEKKKDFNIMNHTTTSLVVCFPESTKVENTPHRRTRRTSPETEDHGRPRAEHRVL